MGLAAALQHIESHQLATLTTYGEYLANNPPAHEVMIHEKSAWSCSHGVRRWHSDCGCNTGGRLRWNQRWRQPLRDALDWLRDELAPRFEQKGAELFLQPWQARDEYIDVILDHSEAGVTKFLLAHGRRALGEEERLVALRLLEMQRHALLMFTSCGWFFDELSGIETVQVIQYAGRAIQLANSLFGVDLEPAFLERLARARSNLPELRDGKKIFEKFVKPAVMDRETLGAHFAVSSLFERYPDRARIYRFIFEQQHRQEFEAGKARMVVGRSKVTFEITGASDLLSYTALHLGDHNVNCGVRYFEGEEAYQQLLAEFSEAFGRADFPQVIRLMDRHFGESNYSLKDLFRDEQRKILNQILASTGHDLESRYRQIADQYMPLMRFLKDIDAPLPTALRTAADYVLSAELRREFESSEPDPARVRMLSVQAQSGNVELRIEELAYAIKSHLDRRMEILTATPEDGLFLARTAELAGVVQELGIEVNLWKTQNLYFRLLNEVMPRQHERARDGDEGAAAWLAQFTTLGDRLGFKVNGGSA